MEITVRYGYAVSIDSLVWALTKRESDRDGAFDWGGREVDGGHLTRGN